MAEKIMKLSIYILGIIYISTIIVCLPSLCHGIGMKQEEEDKYPSVRYTPLKMEETVTEENKSTEKPINSNFKIQAFKYFSKGTFITVGFATGCYIMSTKMSHEELDDTLKSSMPIILGMAIGNIVAESHLAFVDWLMNKN